ncbi:hypothetical protein CRL705_1139 [Latilactobacillus curvatus CRL 705]|nr:hypothetical protein CRL705_1139 [Latilactobacillus curvatus CRL 705]
MNSTHIYIGGFTMRIFVIGAHGNVGQLLISQLVAAGHTVTAGIRVE